jgi:hypothetical protein
MVKIQTQSISGSSTPLHPVFPDQDWVDPYFMGLPDPDPYLDPYSLIKDWKNLRKKVLYSYSKVK